MTTIDIATADGDILLILGETRLRVSSVILSSASPVFKVMLGPNFSEGQGDRSAQNPKEVTLVDDNLATMTRLCRLLHHQRDLPETSPDREPLSSRVKDLYDLAVLADKYGATESIKMAGAYLLFDLGASSKPEIIPIEALLYLISTAFVMEDHRHFILFTKRLVMDHVGNYSRVAHHPALAMLPNLFLLLIEEQRKAVWKSLQGELVTMATLKCPCSRSGTDYNVFAALIAKMPNYRPQGPVSWPASDCSLRFVLKETYNCGSGVNCQVPLSCGHGSYLRFEVDGAILKTLCDRVNKTALGLCLTCLQANAEDGTPAGCSHQQLLERWVENDPFI